MEVGAIAHQLSDQVLSTLDCSMGPQIMALLLMSIRVCSCTTQSAMVYVCLLGREQGRRYSWGGKMHRDVK